jgi:hypothetical protein
MDVVGAIKGVIGAVVTERSEFGFGIEMTGGAGKFVGIDKATLGGGELERFPIGVGFGEFEAS